MDTDRSRSSRILLDRAAAQGRRPGQSPLHRPPAGRRRLLGSHYGFQDDLRAVHSVASSLAPGAAASITCQALPLEVRSAELHLSWLAEDDPVGSSGLFSALVRHPRPALRRRPPVRQDFVIISRQGRPRLGSATGSTLPVFIRRHWCGDTLADPSVAGVLCHRHQGEIIPFPHAQGHPFSAYRVRQPSSDSMSLL